jgi:hypothetical protein
MAFALIPSCAGSGFLWCNLSVSLHNLERVVHASIINHDNTIYPQRQCIDDLINAALSVISRNNNYHFSVLIHLTNSIPFRKMLIIQTFDIDDYDKVFFSVLVPGEFDFFANPFWQHFFAKDLIQFPATIIPITKLNRFNT